MLAYYKFDLYNHGTSYTPYYILVLLRLCEPPTGHTTQILAFIPLVVIVGEEHLM